MDLQLLEGALDPTLIDIMENDQHYHKDHLIGQQDGSPPHYTLTIRQYLKHNFSWHSTQK